MHCPFCSGSDTRVIDSRDTENGAAIRRRRECSGCRQRFTTFERIWGVPVVVLKRDGAREPFDRAKIVSGIAKACKNRPVTDEQMRLVCDEIEEAAREKGAEITSSDIGREVLARLKALDEVAYVRFASVYREFQEVGEFARVVRELGVRVAPDLSGTRGHVGGRG